MKIRNMGSREEGAKRLFSLLFLLLWSNSRGVQGHSDREMPEVIKVQNENNELNSNLDKFINYFSDNSIVNKDVINRSSSDRQSSSSNPFLNFITEPNVEILSVPIKTEVITKLISESLLSEPVDDITSDYLNLLLRDPRYGDSSFSLPAWLRGPENGEPPGPLSLSPVEDRLDFISNKRRPKRAVMDNMIRDSHASPRALKSPFEGGTEKGRQQSESNPDIDDIIHGIMKLLGGNVKIKAELPDTRLTTFGINPTKLVTSSRINNRGPPRLPPLPFGMVPPGSGITRAPIRPPITSPTDLPDGLRPPFMANTRPPFLVPLPPGITAMPTMPQPTLTAIPIPEDVLSPPSLGFGKTNTTATSVSSSFSTATEESTISTTETLPKNETEAGSTTPGIDEAASITVQSQPTTQSIDSTSENELDLTVTTPLESSMMSSTVAATQSSDSTSKSSVVKSINLISNPTKPSNHTLESTSKNESFTTTMAILETTTELVATKSSSMASSSSKKFQSSKSSDRPSTRGSTSSVLLPTHTHPSSTEEEFAHLPTRLPDPIRSMMTTGHPGIVLADTIDYAPVQPHGQVITAPPFRPFDDRPEIFDVTVSALQGFGSAPVRPQLYPQNGVAVAPLITSPDKPGDGSVYIDGRKTYFDLHPATPTNTLQQPMGLGTAIPEQIDLSGQNYPSSFNPRPPPRLPDPPPQQPPPPQARPATLGPPKRIDTCIVGYDTTCNEDLGEMCRTEGDVSSCFCRPGSARRRPRTKCNKSILLHLSLKVDRVGDRRIIWGVNYANPESREYQVLSFEAAKALESALSSSQAMSQLYLDSSVNKFYSLGGRVIVNSTVKLLHTPQTASPNIRKSLQRHLIRVIQGHNNYVGNSVLAVEGTLNPVPDVSDVNECFDPSLYDCHKDAVCSNSFGTYTCSCNKGFTDRYPDDLDKTGRYCDSCSRDYCNKRGECQIDGGQNICACENSFYGARCEIDGEVVGVAVGASVAAVVIIILTLFFLCMWSRRWKAHDRKTDVRTSSFFGGWRNRGARDVFSGNGHQKAGGQNPYGVTMEDRIRWAQIAEQMAQQNLYSPQVGDEDGANLAGTAILNLGTPSSTSSAGRRKASNKVFDEIARLFSSKGAGAKNSTIEGHFTPEEANTLRQLIKLQTRLASSNNNQPEQLRPAPYYQEQRKSMPPPSEYASVGTISGFPQQFGMQHMGSTYMPSYAPSKAQSTYGQYGPPSFNTAASVGGISRAPTLAARTPQQLRDLGPASMGPLGGGAISHKMKHEGGATESSEEEHDRPYHLPRPKSRSSALDSNDIYFEPDDLMTSRYPPLPSNPPPPVPLHFDHFFNMRFS